MRYKVAKPEDWRGIEECIASRDYYTPVDASTLDGITVVAEHNGEIVGCLWAMTCGRHAYLDYFCTRPGVSGRVAAKLALYMERVLRTLGVRWVRGLIKSDNMAAGRIAIGAGMVGDPMYTLVFKEIWNGEQEGKDEQRSADGDRPA